VLVLPHGLVGLDPVRKRSRHCLTLHVTTAMAYIISVNASIMTDSGGTCVCTSTTDPVCNTDPDYAACLVDIKRQFITVIIIHDATLHLHSTDMRRPPLVAVDGSNLGSLYLYDGRLRQPTPGDGAGARSQFLLRLFGRRISRLGKDELSRCAFRCISRFVELKHRVR
jgi:hypothetical protein